MDFFYMLDEQDQEKVLMILPDTVLSTVKCIVHSNTGKGELLVPRITLH